LQIVLYAVVNLTDGGVFGEFAAVTKVALGKGTVRYLAVYPDADLSKYVGAELVAEIGFACAITSPSESVVVNRAELSDGRTAYFVFNWSWQPAQLKFAQELKPILVDEVGEIGAWGVQVYVD